MASLLFLKRSHDEAAANFILFIIIYVRVASSSRTCAQPLVVASGYPIFRTPLLSDDIIIIIIIVS